MRLFTLIIYSFNSIRDELEHWRQLKPLSQAKKNLGLYHVELRKPKDSPEKITLTLVETQQLPDIEKPDSKDELSCLKWTIYNGR